MEVTLGGGMGPSLGAQFAQAVKEVRSAYAGAVTSCAERIAGAVFSTNSITALLQQHRLSPEPSAMAAQVGTRMLHCLTMVGDARECIMMLTTRGTCMRLTHGSAQLLAWICWSGLPSHQKADRSV